MLSTIKQQFPATNFALLALILLMPALGALINGLFGKRMGKDAVRLTALASIGGSFLASLVTFIVVASEPGSRVTWTAWRWFSVTGRMRQDVGIDLAFSADGLSATMLLIVTGVGFLIHLYSTGYMAKDKGFHRFFAYLNLFIFAMLTLVLGDNMAVMFIGWEGVGLASYLLIGFWYEDEKKAAAGKKAFIVNRIGDFGLIMAMVLLVWYSGSLRFEDMQQRSSGLLTQVTLWPVTDLHQTIMPHWLASALTPASPWRVSAATLIGIFLFLGCAGKSAQIPLYVWLPDAMAGPTPVSALIHAATMVTAGVYLVARTSFVFVLSPAALTIVQTTGALTALFAASIAFAQTDLKKVLAYSTVSQLGFMFIGVGSGAFGAGMFHVITHAFFKGCLFLCAGSVIHAMHHRIHDDVASQDMRNMGGLRRYLPLTHATFLLSCIAIAGIPPLAGFWSKDEILFRAFASHIAPATAAVWVPPVWWGKMIFFVGLTAAVCTAFYMFRAYFLTFWGEFRGWRVVANFRPKKHGGHGHGAGALAGPPPHESPGVMTVPLVILAALAVVGGFLYAEPIHVAPLAHVLEPVFQKASQSVIVPEAAHGLVWPLMGAGVLAGVVGVAAAYYVYQVRGGAPARAFATSTGWFYRLVRDKWRIDELYQHTIVAATNAVAETAAAFDRWVIDGIIARLTAGTVALGGALLRAAHTGRVQVYAASMVAGVVGVGWFLVRPHADALVDTSGLRASGRVSLTAASGHGYSYRWRTADDDESVAYGHDKSYAVDLELCEKRTVYLGVKNAFNQAAERKYDLCRDANVPRAPGSQEAAACCSLDDAGRETAREWVRSKLKELDETQKRLEETKRAPEGLLKSLEQRGIKVEQLPGAPPAPQPPSQGPGGRP
ncbi:MAG: NADH-quinone oxidoreductase subunit L [Myxococcales bacterium]|nr:NADH-quinone oxidoreductase subunit L [Myxococcales bacterium]